MPWQAELSLGFENRDRRTVLSSRRHEGPLVVQKPLYPEGDGVCHAIIVHPPGGIAGGDELKIDSQVSGHAHALLTTPGAGKWYRSAGPWARQSLRFQVDGALEWLPRETIVFDGALASLSCEINLKNSSRYIGWEIVCLGRTGSGERFSRGELRLETKISRDGRLLWLERGAIAGGGRLLRSPAGLDGRSVFGTMMAVSEGMEIAKARKGMPQSVALTLLPELLVARYLGDSGEEAMRLFTRLWSALRPAVCGRPAIEPRIWST